MNIKNTISILKEISKKKEHYLKFSKKNLKILVPYIKENKILIIYALIFTLFSSIVFLPAPIIHKIIIDNYLESKNYNMIIKLGGILIIIYISGLILKFLLSYFFSKLNNNILFAIKRDLISKLINLPLSFYADKQSGYLLSRINEVNNLSSIFSFTFVSLIVSFISFGFSVIILGFISWKLLLVTIVFIPIQFYVVNKFSIGIKNISKSLFENRAHYSKNVQEVISGLNTVKTLSTEKVENEKINKSILNVFENSFIQNIIMSMSSDFINFLTNIGNLVILIISVLMIMGNQFTVGLYIASIQYVAKIFIPVQSFASTSIIIQPILVALDRITEYFNLVEENIDEKEKKVLKEIQGKIEFRDVSFSYNLNDPLFQRISFLIKPGEKVALVGKNGTGKTSIIKLLLRLYVVHRGNIYVDDNNLYKINSIEFRKKVGLISQDVFLFNESIKYNLTYGCENYSENELIDLINNFCDYIYDLPEGIETQVGEIGKNLSGGQKQAISVVRTILKKPDILIYDEGTTHLDHINQVKLFIFLNEYFREKTCIFISHNLEIIKKTNRIISIGDYSLVKDLGNVEII